MTTGRKLTNAEADALRARVEALSRAGKRHHEIAAELGIKRTMATYYANLWHRKPQPAAHNIFSR